MNPTIPSTKPFRQSHPQPVYPLSMQIIFDIPEDLAAHLIPTGQDPARSALEALALEGYRSRRLTESQVRRMLGYETRMQVHTLLNAHEVSLDYPIEHLQQDIDASDAFIHSQPQLLEQGR